MHCINHGDDSVEHVMVPASSSTKTSVATGPGLRGPSFQSPNDQIESGRHHAVLINLLSAEIKSPQRFLQMQPLFISTICLIGFLQQNRVINIFLAEFIFDHGDLKP